MNRTSTYLASAILASAAFGATTLPSLADGNVCVSWRHFQEERWRIDEAGIKSALEAAGYTYVERRRAGRPAEAAPDIEGLIARGCAALIVLAQDSLAIVPAIEAAKAAGIPVIAYDVPVDFADIIFISFDNVRGRPGDGRGHGQGEAGRQLGADRGRLLDGDHQPVPCRARWRCSSR